MPLILINWMDVLNTTCSALAAAGCITLASKRGKDSMFGWNIYTIAAILGVIYFALAGNLQQLGVWVIFLSGDLMALRRKTQEKPMRVKFELKQGE